jgi:hypothetical protein
MLYIITETEQNLILMLKPNAQTKEQNLILMLKPNA